MAKKQLTYVPREQLMAIVEKSGCQYKDQAGFTQINCNGNRVYVPRTKTVARIDIAGFAPPDGVPGFIKLDDDLKFGAVEYQMDFTQHPDVILAAFELLLEHAKTLPPAQKKTRAPRAAASSTQAEPVPRTPEAEEALQRLRERRMAIQERAENMTPSERDIEVAEDSAELTE